MRLKVNPWIILQDVGPIPGLQNPNERVSVANGFLIEEAATSPTPAEASATDKKPKQRKLSALDYLNYVRHLQRIQPARTEVERYGSGYQDYLQTPLQPLTDNLESMTYEVFEKDPVKYSLYEQAIQQALTDWKEQDKLKSSPSGKVLVAVCGAGRGPLVTRAIKASEAADVQIDLWAVEKNPNASVLLQRHNREDWDGKVTLVQSDMRSWRGPCQTNPRTGETTYHAIDILISELLGSFADNELSPECLDGMVHLLAKPHGISIPRSYTSFLTPIAAPKLHADIVNRAQYEPATPETPAVVWLHAIDYLSPSTISASSTASSTISRGSSDGSTSLGSAAPIEPQSKVSTANVLKAWSFEHAPADLKTSSSSNLNSHNVRRARLRFRTRYRGVCHGLAGYFESVLYPGIELSTNPNTMDAKSKGMISWFPIFFPLKVGFVSANSALARFSCTERSPIRKHC